MGTRNHLQKVSEFKLDRDSSSSGKKDRLWSQAAWIQAQALPLLNVWLLTSHYISPCLSFPDLERKMTRSVDLSSEGCFVNELTMPVKCKKSVLHSVSTQWKWLMLVLLLMSRMCQQCQVWTLKGDFRKSPPVLQPAGSKDRTASLPNHLQSGKRDRGSYL